MNWFNHVQPNNARYDVFQTTSGSKCWFQQVNLKKTRFARLKFGKTRSDRHGKYVDGDADGAEGRNLEFLHPNWSRDCWWQFDLTLFDNVGDARMLYPPPGLSEMFQVFSRIWYTELDLHLPQLHPLGVPSHFNVNVLSRLYLPLGFPHRLGGWGSKHAPPKKKLEMFPVWKTIVFL